MKMIGPKELVAVLQRYRRRKDYAALKQSCEAAVRKWRWATSLMLPEVPHDDLVRGFSKPKWSKKQPRHGSLHGLDEDGRIRCIRSDDRTKPDDTVYEQFLLHEDGGFWCIFFAADSKKPPLKVQWFAMRGDRWLHSLMIQHNGTHEFALDWEDDRLVRYTWRFWQGVTIGNAKATALGKLGAKEAQKTVYSYSYAADGELERVTEASCMGDGELRFLEMKYQRIPKGSDLQSLLQEAEDLLVAEIPKTIRAAKVQESVYGLFLQFTGVDTDPGGYAPPLFLPTEGLRQRLLEEHPKDREYLWAVPEWQEDAGVVTLACKNPTLDEKLHLVFQLTIVRASRTNYGPVRKMFQRVCARLNALDWRAILKTTDDFVVFPFDPHGEFDPEVDLRASLPPAKLQLLMDRGHLWRKAAKGVRRQRGGAE
jgi:hypothetical protein